MPIEDIIGIILLVLVVVILWIHSIYEYNTSFHLTFFEAFYIPLSITAIASIIIFCNISVNFIKVPEIIEENGYTYQLEGFEPEQTIERYGKTYVLVEE